MSAVPARWTRRRRALALLLPVVTMLAAISVAAPGRAGADVLLIDTFRADAGPFGAISVLGDSVLLGSGYYAPTLTDQLAARGWGPIRFKAGVGHNTGAFGGKLAVQTSYIVQQWRAEGWDPKHVMINIGANDSVTCDGNAECAY